MTPAVQVQPSRWSRPAQGRRGQRALDQSTRQRHAPDRDQLLEVEAKAHAEEQQDDADLGEVLGHRAVGNEAGRERAHQDARQQIADDG
jgi:hypothetical protein